MLLPRIIPCLLVRDGALLKTVKFGEPKYVGDPLNAVRIFNEKEVDELMVIDIGASVQGREPAYGLIESLAVECRMPVCYGGGVRTVDQAMRISSLGVEKVAVSSAAIENPRLVEQAAKQIGSQSVVVVLDVKRSADGASYEIWTHNGQRNTGKCPIEYSKVCEACGAGEIVVNSVDNDGMMQGYDLELAEAIRNAVQVPLTVLGGAGSARDIGVLFGRLGIVGAGAGSIFVFKGKYRAVLITYPTRKEKEALFDCLPELYRRTPDALV